MQDDGEEADFGVTVAALAVGQLLSWAALYYAFSSFVLPMQQSLGWPKRLRGIRMHPRKPPEQAQLRRKAQSGWGPDEHLQRRVGLFWGLTRRAGASKSPARRCIACPHASAGCALRLAQGSWTPRRGCIRMPLNL